MTARSTTSTVLLVCLLLFTFPIWIGLAAGLFGLVVGVFGAVFGVLIGAMGAIFGAIVAIVALPFKLIFGWGHGWSPFFHLNGFLVLMIIVLAVVLIRKNK